MSYHPQKITGRYLGAAMKDEDKNGIIAKTNASNPGIAIFQCKRDAKGRVTSVRE
ncbi:hypothetical protein LPW26_16785 [Rhodopseudomonas sp. HC1]|uniref:hypothetical protein n=1 Tax=Rhodopseudomonas infernalis TaxID=2897386 RepID=UPI001EE90691|nr:hypothetical protein [Rhodopseudomonas infernalis]MCG6206307.1 hypothetical protein [Rhodopseudomonas infernalis]